MMRLAKRTLLLVAFSVFISVASAAAQAGWVLWSGIETIGGPMWQKAETYVSRTECEAGADLATATWVSRMEAQGNQPVRVGTDVIARLSSGAILTAHFVCLPDAKDPRVK